MRPLWLGLLLLACERKPQEPLAVPPPPPIPASQPASAASAPAPMIGDLKNSSGMAYLDPTCGGAGPCRCGGKLEFGLSGVAKIGLGEAELSHGVRCLFGDFDQNGVADMAVYGAGPPDQPADVMVLLFDELGLRAMAPLPKKVGALAIYRQPNQPDALVEGETRALFTWRGTQFEYSRL